VSHPARTQYHAQDIFTPGAQCEAQTNFTLAFANQVGHYAEDANGC